MQLSNLVNIMTTLLVILAVLVIGLTIVFIVTRRRDELVASKDESKGEVRKYRIQRLQLIDQCLSMFSSDNPYAHNLSKLLKLYKGIKSEKQEIMWEEKYIKVMNLFMRKAKEISPQNMKQAWKLSNDAVIRNEKNLDEARTKYYESREELLTYQENPKAILVKIGEAIMRAIRRHAEQQRSLEKEKEDIAFEEEMLSYITPHLLEKGTAMDNNTQQGSSEKRETTLKIEDLPPTLKSRTPKEDQDKKGTITTNATFVGIRRDTNG